MCKIKCISSLNLLQGLKFSLQVEAALLVSPYVDNIMLHADPFHSYCVALVVASQHTVEDWASKQGIAFTNFADLCEKAETKKELLASIQKVSMVDQIHMNLTLA